VATSRGGTPLESSFLADLILLSVICRFRPPLLASDFEAGLNKGESRNALARAVFLCRLGEIRDRSFEQQRYRASGLTLVAAAIALWNTVYIERAVQAFSSDGQTVDPALSGACRGTRGFADR